MTRTHEYQPGDLVRVLQAGNTLNCHKSGEVVEVTRMGGWGGTPGYVLVQTVGDPEGGTQSLRLSGVKLAKQAMRKREQYASRRG